MSKPLGQVAYEAWCESREEPADWSMLKSGAKNAWHDVGTECWRSIRAEYGVTPEELKKAAAVIHASETGGNYSEAERAEAIALMGRIAQEAER